MKIRYFLLGVLFSALVIGMTSCYTNRGEVNEWIAKAPMDATEDFSGRWQVDTESLGWVPSGANRMFLMQDGSRLSGTFEGYDLLGVVDGNAIVLFGLREDVVYFTWHLNYSPSQKAFLGRQCEGYIPVLKPRGYSTAMSVHNIP